MRMLIVEDDLQLQEQLRSLFQRNGWVVDCAPDGREARYLGSEFPVDIAIVDLGLPDISGIQLVRGWREAGLEFPILVLTARSDWRDKVEGLEAGADDYVTKPFQPEEVVARVGALLRRAAGRSSDVVNYGPVQIDFASRNVLREGAALDLTSYEFNTLEYLASRPGQVISKTELTEHLYAQDHERDSNVIEVFIGRLRRKLDPDGELQPIATVRGAGYRFTLQALDP
ncbi:response regulator transcription factor [Haliea sp. E17]|uniref:response regulator transcription factor n=1 Tax=Haliea sp. E17 TaxID=3401576 RepID=UPI003AAD9D2C